MTQREAKIEALRIATAMLNNPPDFSGTNVSIDDEEKIHKEIRSIAASLQKRAEKLGGDFNQFTGLKF